MSQSIKIFFPLYWIKSDGFLLRFLLPYNNASLQEGQLDLSIKQGRRGIPVELPVPTNMRVEFKLGSSCLSIKLISEKKKL